MGVQVMGLQVVYRLEDVHLIQMVEATIADDWNIEAQIYEVINQR